LGNIVFYLCILLISNLLPAKNPVRELPPGIWKSDEPSIVLYFEHEYQHPLRNEGPNFLGTYTTEHGEQRIFTSLHSKAKILTLLHEDSLDLKEGKLYLNDALFAGWFEVIDDEMHYKVGDQTIIFRRVEDYEPINPEDWFRHH
jgi:hypothetical protein